MHYYRCSALPQLLGPGRAMYEKGDADGFAAAYADNAAFTPSLQPFRVDGRAAIKDYFTTFFQIYPNCSRRA